MLVRDGVLHRDTFSTCPDYLRRYAGGTGGGVEWPCDYGPELSRPFLALRIWFALNEHGRDGFREAIERTISLTHYLAGKVRQHPGELELGNEPDTCIVCFRYISPATPTPNWTG